MFLLICNNTSDSLTAGGLARKGEGGDISLYFTFSKPSSSPVKKVLQQSQIIPTGKIFLRVIANDTGLQLPLIHRDQHKRQIRNNWSVPTTLVHFDHKFQSFS